MYTFKSLAYYLTILSIILISLLFNNWDGFVLAIPLIAIVAFSLSYPLPREVKLEVKRRVEPIYTIKGETVEVEVVVSNRDSTRYIVRYEDQVPGKAVVEEGYNSGYLVLKPDESKKIKYTLRIEERGHYSVGPLNVKIVDPLELRFIEDDLGGEVEVAVFPEFEKIPWFKIFSEYTGVWPGEIHSRKSGQGYDFYGVREYVCGDEFKRINWSATAKWGRLMSNEYESEKVTDVLLIVDASGEEVIGVYLKDVIEFEVSIAASLALTYLKHGDRVGLVAHGRHRAWIKPAFGKNQFFKILHCLADLHEGSSMPLKFMVGTITPYILKPKAEVVIISPLLEKEIIDLVRELLAMDYKVLVLSPNPYSLITGKEYRNAVRVLSLKREILKLQLLKYCLVVDWDPRLPFKQVVKYLKTMRLRMSR
ncbi:MAG: hypothetical protein DRJ38_07060 [Thermoprotei archaeon]|nr:MAG: hypothetical protein DRJ38_07060 [Thermoprotei archaeon]